MLRHEGLARSTLTICSLPRPDDTIRYHTAPHLRLAGPPDGSRICLPPPAQDGYALLRAKVSHGPNLVVGHRCRHYQYRRVRPAQHVVGVQAGGPVTAQNVRHVRRGEGGGRGMSSIVLLLLYIPTEQHVTGRQVGRLLQHNTTQAMTGRLWRAASWRFHRSNRLFIDSLIAFNCCLSLSPPRAGDFIPPRLQNAHPVQLFVGVVYMPTWVRRPCAHGTMAESKQAFHLHARHTMTKGTGQNERSLAPHVHSSS